MGNKIFLNLLVVILIFGLAKTVRASGITDTYGVGSRAIALGGAFTAVADDYTAAYYNPAGLGQINGHHFALEYHYTMPDIEVKKANGEDLILYGPDGAVRTDPTDCAAGDGLDLGLPVIGFVLDINKIAKLPVKTTFGLAACLPEQGDVGYRMHDMPPDQPHLIRYGDNIDRITLAVGVGVEAVKDLISIGAGVQAMLFGPGSFYIDGLTLNPGNVASKSEFGALFKYEPVFGLLFTPLDKRVRIGFSWKDQQELKLGVMPNVATVSAGGLDVSVPMNLDINAFFTPEEYSAGLAFDLDPLLISLEVDKQMWSAYEYSVTDSYHYPDPPDFEDTYNYRVGLEYKLNPKTSLMAGYYHQPSPVPDQSGRVSNYLDLDKDVFSLGGSYILDPGLGITKGPVKLAGVVQYQKMKDLDVNKDGVTGVSWVDQESYTVKGNAVTMGASMIVSWK
ncbi:MAG: outer membrane protein transport protein [Syntrophaceae bacterium]